MSIYLDHNATTPVDPRVLEAMLPWFTQHFGNAASSTHAFGWQAAEAVKIAREETAALIGASPEEIIFTSGSTEALNLALKGVAERYAEKGRHFITAATEHKAVLDTLHYLSYKGCSVTVLPVNEEGFINLEELENAITPQTVLISLMIANNETGVIHPVKDVSTIARRHGVLLLSDTTQAAGKVPVNVNELGIDLCCLSAHKMNGPKGAGALYVRRRDPRVSLEAQLHGGGHERGLRSGTLNVPGIVGLGKAAAIAAAEMKEESARLAQLRDALEQTLMQEVGALRNGAASPRLPNTSNLSFVGIEAQRLIKELPGLAIATGSACTSAKMEPSHVLSAMGFDTSRCLGSLRFSLGRSTTAEEVSQASARMVAAVQRLRTA